MAGAVLEERKGRRSGIELLKLIALFLIVISHMVQTLGTVNEYYGSSNYVLDLHAATQDPQHLVLSFLWAAGALGNAMFFICSAWYLLDDDKVNAKKIAKLVIEVLLVSIAVTVVMLIVRKGKIDTVLLIKSLAPTTFSNNWYVTCYLLFYAVHPALNLQIRSLPKQKLLIASMTLSILYLCAGLLYRGLFFGTELMTWIAVYFALAYVKKYMPEKASDQKTNIVVLVCSVFTQLVLVLLTNFIGLRISGMRNMMLHWSSNCSPIIILTALAAFNIARMRSFRNRSINCLARLSLLIYIIHENILLRTYVRPAMFEWIQAKFGYDHILLWVLITAAGVFILSLAISLLVDLLINKPAERLSDLVVKEVSAIANPVCEKIKKLK